MFGKRKDKRKNNEEAIFIDCLSQDSPLPKRSASLKSTDAQNVSPTASPMPKKDPATVKSPVSKKTASSKSVASQNTVKKEPEMPKKSAKLKSTLSQNISTSATPVTSNGDKARRVTGWSIIGVAGITLSVMFAICCMKQCSKAKDLRKQNEELKVAAQENASNINESDKTISYLRGQRDQLEADLGKCRECAPQPVAKPEPQKPVVAPRPQPKPQPAPAPVVQPAPVVAPAPIIIRDTIRLENPTVIRDTVFVEKDKPVADEPVVRPAPIAKPAYDPNHMDSLPATVTARFRNKMASDAKCH